MTRWLASILTISVLADAPLSCARGVPMATEVCVKTAAVAHMLAGLRSQKTEQEEERTVIAQQLPPASTQMLLGPVRVLYFYPEEKRWQPQNVAIEIYGACVAKHL